MEQKNKELVVKQEKSLSGIMAEKYLMSQDAFLKTIKATVIRGTKDRQATDAEVAAFLTVSNKYNLDPFTNEIYAFPSKKGGIVPIVGVDGFVTIANREKTCDGWELEYAEKTIPINGKQCPEWMEIRVYRKDRTRPTVIREYLNELYIEPRGGHPGPWQTHTMRMFRHKVICQGLRVAFGITGIYDEDEGRRIIEAQEQEVSTGRPEITMPKSTIEQPIKEKKEPTGVDILTEETPPPAENPTEKKSAYAKMLKRFRSAKQSIGEEAYYRILGDYDFKHANEVKKTDQGEIVLSDMLDEFSEQNKKKTKGETDE